MRQANPDHTMLYALDFSAWKRPAVRRCFADKTVVFLKDAAKVPAGGTVVVWGMKPFSGRLAPGTTIIRLEDGFLRSVGLGADLIRPMSWVVDHRGMYYDATRPSDLEQILAQTDFSPELVCRAAALRKRIVAQGLTKYNIGARQWQRPGGDKQVLLVPGQVESDASLAYGAPGIRTNLDLLRAVRQENPNAFLVYKPHPDVIAGLRAKGTNEDQAQQWCDQVVVDVPMDSLLSQVDGVQVLTSLAGFEALLRHKPVTCYGQPFYAGWGLTQDIIPHPRRQRRLTLDQLVAGALLLYPLYLSRSSDALISAEQALDELIRWRAQTNRQVPWWRHCVRFFVRRIAGVR